MLLELNDRGIERRCAAIREKMVALHNYGEAMSKAKVMQLCEEIILGMIDILEMIEK
jgi:hypothetical protein